MKSTYVLIGIAVGSLIFLILSYNPNKAVVEGIAMNTLTAHTSVLDKFVNNINSIVLTAINCYTLYRLMKANEGKPKTTKRKSKTTKKN